MATTIEKAGARCYFIGLPFSAKDRAKSMGAKWDADRRVWWVGAVKMAAAESLAAELNAGAGAAPVAEDLDDKRVYAKVTKDGRTLYVIGQTTDSAGQPLRVRLVAFADGSVPFWADAAACELVKEYRGRPERGSYGRETGRTVYTTLGSIRSFVAGQKADEKAGVPQCPVCGKRGQLHHDLEDGLMKCYRCCDIPE